MGTMYEVDQSTGAIGDPVLGDGPIVGGNAKFTKLWENPNPSQAISTQQIDIGSNNYDGFMVESTTGTIFIKKATGGYILVVGTSGGIFHIWSRYVSASATYIMIYECNQIKISDGSTSVKNDMAIPLAIYGINIEE